MGVVLSEVSFAVLVLLPARQKRGTGDEATAGKAVQHGVGHFIALCD